MVDKPAPGEDVRVFNDRLATIERQVDDKRQAEVLARLRKHGGEVVGMPAGVEDLLHLFSSFPLRRY